MSAEGLNIIWTPPGPVAARFMSSTAKVQTLNGPVGSGKTTACLIKGIRLAQRQMVSTQDSTVDARGQRAKVRKFKLCCVRDTYRQLWKTTLPSWWKRVPRDMGDFSGSDGGPATHIVKFQLADGTVVLMQVDFIAIGDNAAEDVLRGYEPTAFYLNEADLLAEEVFLYALGRAGRYPDISEGGASWFGVLMDCNAPELMNWLYRLAFKVSPEKLLAMNWALFRQPGGREPDAENLTNLPTGYYQLQAAVNPDWYVARMVDNTPGYSRAGKPIYPEFKDAHHVASHELPFTAGLVLFVGLDAGLSPAAVFGQRMPNGVWRILDELVSEQGTGPVRFAADLARRLKERFGGARTVRGFADPSAAYGADRKNGDQDWIEIVASRAGLSIVPAPTNALTPRLEAVRLPLTRLIDGEFAFQLSPRCEVLREGFASGYRFRKLQAGDDRYADEPDKNEYSHPHDALQYLLGAGGEDKEIRDRKDRQMRLTQQHQRASSWDPLAQAG